MKMLNALNIWIKNWTKRNGEKKFSLLIQSEKWVRWLIGSILLIALVLMFPRGKSLQFADMKEGSISTRRIVAPFNFEILKTKEEYREDRERAVRDIYPIFSRDENKIQEVEQALSQFFHDIELARKKALTNPGLIPVLGDSLFQKYNISMDAKYRDLLINNRSGIGKKALDDFRDHVNKVIRDIMVVGVMGVEKERLTAPDRRLVMIKNNEEVIYSFNDFFDLPEARIKATETLNGIYSQRTEYAQMGFGIVNFFIRPNLGYDEEAHLIRIRNAEAKVPLSSGFVDENEKIVDRNERITPEIRKKLLSLATKMAEKGMQEGGIQRLFSVIGKVAFVLVLFFLMGVFIYQEQSDIFKKNTSFLLVALIIFVVSLFTFLIHRLDASEYLVPTALGSMLLTALFNSRFGYVSAAVLSVLVGGLWGNEFNLMVVSFFVGVVGVISIGRIRDRRQFIQAIFFMAGAYIFAITFMGFLRFLPFREIIKEWPFGALTGLFTPIMTYGLLPLVESIFGVTTDFSLLELSNLNHPLLKRLSVQAPGTYHHSIIVGNLAEAAAQSVGANSLLARVGSYYHDVGKIDKAEYFVENQTRGENPHEKLTPRMSALILMNHVKRGLELAEKYKLPSSIKDIIVQHQGTAVMNFFYQKAKSKNGSQETSKEDYRYPGPRPQSKEAAIVMLADSVEAAARSLKGPTHSRLKGLIEDLVDARFKEGQLDKSPLTLRDLERIKESFLMILAGTFHTRIDYPDDEEQTSLPKGEK